MFEYSEDMVLRSLDIWGFDIKNININKIVHVPMHQYRITTNNEHLYVENLQCCVGLYAYNSEFGFASHINPVVMRGDDYELDENGIPISLKRINDLKQFILTNKNLINSLKIGIVLGSNPLNEKYSTYKMIDDAIDSLIVELNYIGIDVEKLIDMHASAFILDVKNNKVILADEIKINKIKTSM